MSTGMPDFPIAELEARRAAWTAREIAQQPAVWLEVLQGISASRAGLDAFLAPLLANPLLRIVLSGAGTSAYIGDCLAPALAARLSRRVEAIATTDIVSGPLLRLQRDVSTLLVSFARSGNSPESVATVNLAEQLVGNIHHLIITCNPEGELARRASSLRSARVVLLPEATNDRGFAMTSSFSSMLLAAGLLFGVIRSDSVAALSRAASALQPPAWSLAKDLVARKFQRVVFLGSNELSGLACEAALKLLELTDGRIVALPQSPLGFRHGPKTIVDRSTLVVLMLSNDPHARAYDLDLLNELRQDARAGHVLALSALEEGLPRTDRLLYANASHASDLELALLHILVAQSYAFTQSMALGLTPDNPNAAGVVSRVVQGVTIYPLRESDVPRR